MSSTASEKRQYYLGIAGEQVGPLTEAALLERMRKGNIPADALVWYEGLAEWVPLDSLAELKAALNASEEATASGEPALAEPAASEKKKYLPAPSKLRVVREEQREEMEEVTMSFAEGEASSGPIFSRDQAVFSESPFVKYRMAFMGIGVGIFVLIVGAIFYFWANTSAPPEPTAPVPKVETPEEIRLTNVRTVLSELYLKPSEKIPELIVLVKENADDAGGREALQAVVDYYRQIQRPGAAGDLLMSIKKPAQAAELFLVEPADNVKAEAAYYNAFELEKNPAERQKYLGESIRLAVGPLGNVPLAATRVRTFEKEFPNTPHPYGYYLKTTDEQVEDLFSRISFYYVQKLIEFMNVEIPQINMRTRPRVEIRKEKLGNYRMVGIYRGEVVFNQDRLNDIYFTFWWKNGRWAIVETNLTPERTKFAKAEKAAAQKDVLTPAELLGQLETVFRAQFPKNALHESGDQLKAVNDKSSP